LKRSIPAIVMAIWLIGISTALTNLANAAPPTTATSKSATTSVVPTAKELTIDLNGVKLKMVRIPAGTFTMGSPKDERERFPNEPSHKVTITKAYYIGVTEVTQAQYEAVMGTNPSSAKAATNPVVNLSWDEAVDFCTAMSAKTGRDIRLPTEAQWEYACRAGTTSPFSTGATLSLKDANYFSFGEGVNRALPVGSYRPNAWGLYDMHGNVSEWCFDWDSDLGTEPAIDPTGPAKSPVGNMHILRGGDYRSNDGANCRSARRAMNVQGYRSESIGFRVVLLPGSAAK
jgi:formylglycine-generating enzyme required for sulfatase activity